MADDSGDGEPTPGALSRSAARASIPRRPDPGKQSMTAEPMPSRPRASVPRHAGGRRRAAPADDQDRAAPHRGRRIDARRRTTDESVYVFGANVGAAPDAATAKLAKRVLQISVVLILLQAIIAVVYYVRDEPLALILITFCFSLAHPTCGIFGVMNKDRSLLCMFCGYGCIQCAADAITCVLCIVYAVSKSGKKRRDFAMLAAYYFVQGVIHYVVFYWGNKLYIHKGFDARAVHPEARAARRRRREAVPVAATSRLEDDGFAAAAYADVEAGQPWVLSPGGSARTTTTGPTTRPPAAAAVSAVTPREEAAGPLSPA